MKELAIHGGIPVREKYFPERKAFGEGEIAQLTEAIQYYASKGEDIPYNGYYEKTFCKAFSEFHSGGYADAVASGTAAVYVALAALDLPKGCEVIISPVCDSGPINSVILQGYVPVIADSDKNSYNMSVEALLNRITEKTGAIIAVHSAGEPLDIETICKESKRVDIKVLEDCSQAHGAKCNGKYVGTFGDVAAFSTMYRKNIIAGSSSGIVYTKDNEIYKMVLAHADRGKQIWRTDLYLNDPSYSLFPALNFNSDELSCAIGIASLNRLTDTIKKRVSFIKKLIEQLKIYSQICRPYAFHEEFSPFFFPIFVDRNKISCEKKEFAQAIAAEGIPINPHYGCVISTWKWIKSYLKDDFKTTNAIETRDNSFNLNLNENYGDQEVKDIIDAIVKIEKYYLK